MRLYGAIQKVEPQDDGTVRVHGIAASEAVDDQGEVVQADAIRAAIPDYMRFPALREMHQLAAAGTTLEAEVGDDGVTRIVAHVVDPVAVTKVKNQVYRGFSIGGKVTRREPGNPKVITGLVLNEISLVDRPANPEAVFDCWKAAEIAGRKTGKDQVSVTDEPFNPPIQIWACGVPDHHHLAKNDALRCVQDRMLRSGDPAGHQPGQVLLGDGCRAELAIDAARKAIATAEGALANTDGRETSDGSNSFSGPYHPLKYADPGFQSDGRRRYPIDTERHIRAAWSYINNPKNAARYATGQLKQIKDKIIAAWKETIDAKGPPSAEDDAKASCAALTKALWDVGRIAQIILELDWLRDALEIEATMEGDQSIQPVRLEAIIGELCSFLNALVAEETGELLENVYSGPGCSVPNAAKLLRGSAGPSGAARIAALLNTGNPKMQQLATDLVAKAKHSQADQALADMALYACDKCMEIDGLAADEKEHVSRARDHLLEAGAAPWAVSVVDAVGDVSEVSPQMNPPSSDFRPGDNATVDTSKLRGATGMTRAKYRPAHQNLMDIAHDCIRKLTDARTCSQEVLTPGAAVAREGGGENETVIKMGARHSQETLGHLCAAHDHLLAAGAACVGPTVIGEEEHQGTEFDFGKTLRPEELAKVLADERAEKAALVKTLSEMVPLLDRLSKRVDDIASTPLPPLTITRGSVAVSKQQDGGAATNSDAQLSPEAIAAALANMSKEEQTLTLIKASYAKPIPVLGVPPSGRAE
ncbi:MAG: hypothetical protein JO358_19395 [Alphaproteobacteria bacterium]|nr:hypothetical protein [Alphaproteobacteria bacterium]